MMLDTITLTGASYSKKPVKKLTTYQHLWSDTNEVEESGLGICSISVTGILLSVAARDALEQACESKGAKKLYFTSAIGATADDRYYNVYTQPLQSEPAGKSATVYNCSFECLAADSTVYLTATDLAVW